MRRATQSDWATLVVIVHKKDGILRLCEDYNITVNTVLKMKYYQLPRSEDLCSAIAGGEAKFLCVLDLSATLIRGTDAGSIDGAAAVRSLLLSRLPPSLSSRL